MDKLWVKLDRDGSGKIDFKEFMAIDLESLASGIIPSTTIHSNNNNNSNNEAKDAAHGIRSTSRDIATERLKNLFVPVLHFLNVSSSGNVWLDMQRFGQTLQDISPSFLERQLIKAIFNLYDKVLGSLLFCSSS
jgi:hypothetical protein